MSRKISNLEIDTSLDVTGAIINGLSIGSLQEWIGPVPTAKGTIIVGNNTNIEGFLGGTDGQVLKKSAAATTGLIWADEAVPMQFTLQTTNNIPQTIQTINTLNNTIYNLDVKIVAKNAANNLGASFFLKSSFRRFITLSQYGDDTILIHADGGASDWIVFTIQSGTDILIQVQGDNQTIDWTCQTSVLTT